MIDLSHSPPLHFLATKNTCVYLSFHQIFILYIQFIWACNVSFPFYLLLKNKIYAISSLRFFISYGERSRNTLPNKQKLNLLTHRIHKFGNICRHLIVSLTPIDWWTARFQMFPHLSSLSAKIKSNKHALIKNL